MHFNDVATLPGLLWDNIYACDDLQLHVPASIIIVSYNSAEHLQRCLISLHATLDGEYEVILVDNASTDGSADYVAQKFPWVRLVRLQKNEGFAAANNIGIELASYNYVVALNPDTEVANGWLDALLSPFEQDEPYNQHTGLTTARILMMQKPHSVNTCGNNMHITGITTCRGLGKQSNDPALAEKCTINAVSGACFAMPRDLWLELGGLDPEFFTYVEDSDLSLRVRAAGYKCVYVPGSTVYHKYTATFGARKLYYLERNRALMLLKCFQWRTLFLMLPVLFLAECIAWGYAFKNGLSHIKAKWQAYTWLARNIKIIRRKHRQVKQTKQVTDRLLLETMEWRLDLEQLAGPKLGKLAGAILNPLFHAWRIVALPLLGSAKSARFPQTSLSEME